MTYKKRFVAVVKHKGKILREDNGVVRLPFGSDYSILLKNLDTIKAVAKISIDGKDVMKHHSIIVDPNSSVELKGFMEWGLKVKNKFRFIEKTDDVRNFRGDRVDDGIIRIEFQFENKWNFDVPRPLPIQPTWPDIRPGYEYEDLVGRYMKSFAPQTKSAKHSSQVDWSYTSSDTVGASSGNETIYYTNTCSTAPVNDDGITVKGSETKQNFNYGHVGTLESQSHVIILRLKGTVTSTVSTPGRNNMVVTAKTRKVKKPITVKTRLQCSSCGRKWKSSYKFCPKCSTYLE